MKRSELNQDNIHSLKTQNNYANFCSKEVTWPWHQSWPFTPKTTDTKYIYIETLLHGMSELLWDCTRDRNNLKLYLVFIIIYTHFLNVDLSQWMGQYNVHVSRCARYSPFNDAWTLWQLFVLHHTPVLSVDFCII